MLLKLLPLLLLQYLVLEEFEVLAENFDREAIEVDCLAAGLVHPYGLFLYLLVFQHHELLDGEHLVPECLDRHKFVIWLRLLDLCEYFEDLVVFVLNLYQPKLLFFVFTHKTYELT